MFFPRGDEHNKRFMGELADVLRQQHAIQRRNIDIQKNGVDAVMLQNFNTSRPSSKVPTISIWLCSLISQLSSCCAEFVFNNDDFHNITPAQSNNVACEATGVRWLGM